MTNEENMILFKPLFDFFNECPQKDRREIFQNACAFIGTMIAAGEKGKRKRTIEIATKLIEYSCKEMEIANGEHKEVH